MCASSLPSAKRVRDVPSQERAVAGIAQWSVQEQKTVIAGLVVKMLNPYLKNKKIASKV